jgi:large subunit ribosomal protein L35
MPKRKTVKGVKDRFKMTGTGKIVRHRSGRRHLLSGRRAKVKRQLRRPLTLLEADARKIRPLLLC